MTQRQHDTRVALRKAIHVHGAGSEETRLAAIELCYAYNIDPHWRYAVWPKLTEPPSNEPMIEPAAVGSVSEWQRVVKRFVKDGA